MWRGGLVVDGGELEKMPNFGKWIKENRIFSIAAFITNSVIFLTVMSASFWFGQRGTKSQVNLRGVDNG